jgi:hypothetical protein
MCPSHRRDAVERAIRIRSRFEAIRRLYITTLYVSDIPENRNGLACHVIFFVL